MKALRRLMPGLVLVLAAGAASAQGYRFDLLPSNGSRYFTPTGINNLGQVAGTVGDSHFPFASTWDANHPSVYASYLPTYEECCTYIASVAWGINDRGQVVGDDTGRVAVWNGHTRPTLLGGVTGYGSARDVNDSGVVVGYFGSRATLWDSAGAHVLGSLGGSESYAYAVNESGTAAGMSTTGSTAYDPHAVLWQAGGIVDLGAGAAFGLNDHGVAVGASDERATLWSGGQATFLGTRGSFAWDINNSGWAVGYLLDELSNGPLTAMLWRNGQSIDLNSFLSQAERDAGWQLETANAINDRGWIVGTAFNTVQGVGSAFVLSIPAVPEPASIALLLAGLGVIGTAACRNLRRTASC